MERRGKSGQVREQEQMHVLQSADHHFGVPMHRHRANGARAQFSKKQILPVNANSLYRPLLVQHKPDFELHCRSHASGHVR